MPPEEDTTGTVAPITPPPASAPPAASGFTPSAEDQQLITLFEQAVELDDMASGAAEALADTTATATSAVAAAQDKVNATGDLAASKWRELTEALTVRGRKSKVPAVVNIFTSILIAVLALSIGTGCNEAHRAPQQDGLSRIDQESERLAGELRLLRQDLRDGLLITDSDHTLHPTLVSIHEELAAMRSELKRSAVVAAFVKPRRDPVLGQIVERLDQLAACAKTGPCACAAGETAPSAAATLPAEVAVKPAPFDPRRAEAASQVRRRGEYQKLRPCRPRGRCTSCAPLLVLDLACDALAGNPHEDRPLRYWTPIRNLIENLRPVRRALKLFRDPQRAAFYAPSVA